MKEKLINKTAFSSPSVKMLVAGFVLFLCAFAFSPTAQILRTVPFFIVGGAIAFVLSSSVKFTLSLSFVMTLCTYLVFRGNVGEAVFFSLVSCLVSAAGIYVFRFLKAAKITSKKVVRSKCILCAVLCFVVASLLSVVVCGNAFSFVIHNAENVDYIKNNYGKDVNKRYTSYEFLKGEYRTYVSFKDGENVYGNADECYINADEKHFDDGVRNYHEENMLISANAGLAFVVSGATWGYNITSSDIVFEKGEILTSQSVVEDYLDRVSYVVSFQTLFGKNDRDSFVRVCEDTVLALENSGFEFEKIVLCGGNAKNVLFCAEITGETKREDVSGIVTDFDESLVKSIGVTEMTILDYWENK